MNNKYVLVHIDRDETAYATISTPDEIINAISFRDCTEEMHRIYRVEKDGALTELKGYGTWHCADVLYIKITDQDGNIEFDGYGTDH